MIFVLVQIIFLSYMTVAKLVWKKHLLPHLSLSHLLYFQTMFPQHCCLRPRRRANVIMHLSRSVIYDEGYCNSLYIFLHEISVTIQNILSQNYLTLLWSIGIPFSKLSSKSISQCTSANKTHLKIFSSLFRKHKTSKEFWKLCRTY